MTILSVNLNKIALLRNARGRDFPNVVAFANKFIALGARGITVHPRPDERHITYQDTIDLGQLLNDNHDVEFNIEGYPTEPFLDLVEQAKPNQCTLVPDSPDQITSDHGWNLQINGDVVRAVCIRLSKAGIRTSLFLDPDTEHVQLAKKVGADRIELYTEAFANAFYTPQRDTVIKQYHAATQMAQTLGIGVNAGHDLDLENLAAFLTIDNILEVSIGHALIVECLEQGLSSVVKQYLDICNAP